MLSVKVHGGRNDCSLKKKWNRHYHLTTSITVFNREDAAACQQEVSLGFGRNKCVHTSTVSGTQWMVQRSPPADSLKNRQNEISQECLWEGEGSWGNCQESVRHSSHTGCERWTGGTQHQNATILSSCHYSRTLPHNNVVLPGFKACMTVKWCNYVEWNQCSASSVLIWCCQRTNTHLYAVVAVQIRSKIWK